MLLLANGLSGSQRAAVLAQDCARRLRLHACQVRLLTNDAAMVTRVLDEWRTVPGHVVCVMGGDGTVSCVMAAMDSLDYSGGAQGRPALLVVPQGTGNDLARALGCGAAAPSVRAVLGILKRIPYDAPDAIVQLDRWHVTGPRAPDVDVDVGPARHVFNNYCSFGMGQQSATGVERASVLSASSVASWQHPNECAGFDARVISRFHTARNKHPWLYQFRHLNYLWYFVHSCASMFSNVPLHRAATLTVDGCNVEIPAQVHALVFLNIPSYGGGRSMPLTHSLPFPATASLTP
jgi:hypothetical protein